MTRRAERGFTLLEVVVALAILSLSAVAVLRIVGGGLRGATGDADLAETVTLAENELARLVHDRPVSGRTTLPSGHRLEREVVALPDAGALRVVVTVTPPDARPGRVVRLVTLTPAEARR